MVDKRGRLFLPSEIDPDFLKNNVNIDLYGEFAGRFVKNAYDPELTDNDPTLDIDLSILLKRENKAFKVEKHEHNYPHCWRTDKPVLYYPLDSWFIKTTAVRDRMIELNKTINWKPASTGEGLLGYPTPDMGKRGRNRENMHRFGTGINGRDGESRTSGRDEGKPVQGFQSRRLLERELR